MVSFIIMLIPLRTWEICVHCSNYFSFNRVEPNEMTSLILSFQNLKSSIYNVSVFVLKQVCHVIAPILADLFNESIETGSFPDQLKLGRVIPLHKSGSKTCIQNFRPITTLSIFSKIFEKFIHYRFYYFLKKF